MVVLIIYVIIALWVALTQPYEPAIYWLIIGHFFVARYALMNMNINTKPKPMSLKKKGDYQTLDDREITPEEWARYEEAYREWEKRYEGRLHTMDAAMSEPNPPNYKFANND